MSVLFTPAGHLTGPWAEFANRNAVDVLDLLGLDREDLCGQAPAEDFLGRVLIARGLLDIANGDEGRPDLIDGPVIDCGRVPGYLAARLAELEEVAEWAHAHHLPVAWG
ncbi:hypothetical protein [Nocardiopsis synnemataformans]|uniref:hypothetical protein n=1 Tax=Nocardiopsis synnemataformans TaxID=61305 RepID=UPI003EBD53C1